jgi:hypothetical protein
MIIYRSVLRRMRDILDKSCREKTHFMFGNFSPNIMPFWDNVEKYCRARRGTDNVIRRMRLACWIPKTANTHSAYVILTAFPLQQCLQERVSVSRYTYIAFFVSACNHMQVQILVSVFEAGGRLVSLGWWVEFLDLHWYCGVSKCSLAVFRAQATDDIIRLCVLDT